MSDNKSIDQKSEQKRRNSEASSRKSSVASNTSAISAVSRYSSASFMGPSGEQLHHKHKGDGSPKPVLRRTWTDLRKDPGLESVTVEWNRAINATLRHISPEERTLYERFMVEGISSQFTIGNLADTYATSLRFPASEYMIHFNIKTRKGLLHRKVRLSHCSVVASHSSQVTDVVSRMQAGLGDSEEGYALPFPTTCTLSKAFFHHGLREKSASSGLLQINLAIEDPSQSLHKLSLTSFHCPLGIDAKQRLRFISEYWRVNAVLPSKGRRPISLTIPFSKLDHQDAFPDRLKRSGTEKDLKKWIGPTANGHLVNFIVTDVKVNVLGEPMSARLKRITGPFSPILECDAPAAQPTPMTMKERLLGKK